MAAPTILGVKGEPCPRGTHRIAWRIGPWRAVVVDRAALRLGSGVAGMLNIDTDGRGLRSIGLLRIERDSVEEVAAELESWLKHALTETVGALGLELRERGELERVTGERDEARRQWALAATMPFGREPYCSNSWEHIQEAARWADQHWPGQCERLFPREP